MRREYPGVPQKLFATPIRDSGRKPSNAKVTGELSIPIDTEKPVIEYLKEGQQRIPSMQVILLISIVEFHPLAACMHQI